MAVRPGKNIALKIPRSAYEATVTFYRDALGFPVESRSDQSTPSHCADFGSHAIWLDCVDRLGRGDVWLEAETVDLEGTLAKVRSLGGVVRDEVEPLPEGTGHWIADPAGNTILLTHYSADQPRSLPQAIPQLPSGDLDVTEHFYRETLSFDRVRRFSEEGFLIVRRENAELHFWLTQSVEQARQIGGCSSCYFRTQEVETLFEEFKSRNAPFAYELKAQPWGMNEFQINDPFGCAIRFGWPLK